MGLDPSKLGRRPRPPHSKTFPKELLDCGGVIGEIMSYTMNTAKRPNAPLAFAGAVSLLSMLMARVWRNPENSRTPLYIIALGDSGVGKQAARTTNQKLASEIGMSDHVVGNFRSGEALEDFVLTKARLLSQYDEIDTLFRMMREDGSSLSEVMMGKMLDLWSDQGGYTKRRLLAANAANMKVNVPNVCYHPGFALYGTAVTERFYEAMNDRMKTNGLFARLLIVEAAPRANRTSFVFRQPDQDLVDRLKSIAGVSAVTVANQPGWNDTGAVIMRTGDADELHNKYADEADTYYDTENDGADNALWSRAEEKMSKLEMIFAMSRDCGGIPRVMPEDVELAKLFVWHCTDYSLRLLKRYSAETEFQVTANKIKEIIRKRRGVGHTKLLQLCHLSSSEFKEVIETLVETGEVVDQKDRAANGKETHYYTIGEEEE